MEYENGVSQEKKSNIILNFLAIFVLLGLLFYAVMAWKSADKTKSAVVLDELPSLQQLEIVKSSNENEISQTSKEANISFSDLPQYLQGIFTDRTIDFMGKTVAYEDGSNGFSVEYTLNDTVLNSYSLFHKNSKTTWPPKEGRRTDGAAFLHIENEVYSIKADFLKLDEVNTAVKVMVIKK